MENTRHMYNDDRTVILHMGARGEDKGVAQNRGVYFSCWETA